VIQGRVVKIPSNILVDFDPDVGASSHYCETLRSLAEMFSERSVIAAIPTTFTGRAVTWFASHTMDRTKMRTVEGWIEMLQKQFRVNTAVAREKAKSRKYDPRKDEFVMDYFYAKVNLLCTSKAEIDSSELIDEIWLGLPPSF
jgi:hypothetical protein